MKTYKINEDTIWEETNKVVINNYPPSGKTFSYAQKVYREYKKSAPGWKEVNGNPIYFYDMTTEQRALAVIIAEAQNALNHTLGCEKGLKEIKD